MPDEPQLPNPKYSLPEISLISLFAVTFDFIKLILGPLPIIDLFGEVVFIFGQLGYGMYLFLRAGPSSMFGGKKASVKLLIDVGATLIGLVPVVGDFIPELTIESTANYLIAANENRAAKKEYEEAQAAQAAQSVEVAPYQPPTRGIAPTQAANEEPPAARAGAHKAPEERKRAA